MVKKNETSMFRHSTILNTIFCREISKMVAVAAVVTARSTVVVVLADWNPGFGSLLKTGFYFAIGTRLHNMINREHKPSECYFLREQ